MSWSRVAAEVLEVYDEAASGPAHVRTGRQCPVSPAGSVRERLCAVRQLRPDRALGEPPGAQVQRRTLTPSTTTVLQTTAGLRTTTAPRAPAQPAR